MKSRWIRRAAKPVAVLLGVSAVLVVGWMWLFALEPYSVTAAQMRDTYAYPAVSDLDMQLQPLSDRSWAISYRSYDGARVNGRIHFPQPPRSGQKQFPVMLGAHGMGRSEVRWWEARFKDTPTLEQTDALSRLALERGHAVITIDARYHGHRKDPQRPLRDIMRDLHYFGDRHDYESMVRSTVLDHRVLLDWVTANPALDAQQIKVAGYSMGAQVALLLAGVDTRVRAALAIVPPHVGDGTAIVAPRNAADGLLGKRIWLISADDDEYARTDQNLALFNTIPTADKQHIVYAGGHILPHGYVADLMDWF